MTVEVSASRAGAWIETIQRLIAARIFVSRPSRRGVDRSNDGLECDLAFLVDDLAGAWIEAFIGSQVNYANSRRRSRRGVDIHGFISGFYSINDVAPHTGAWIESCSLVTTRGSTSSRPSRRGVDRNSSSLLQEQFCRLYFANSLCCVDRNDRSTPVISSSLNFVHRENASIESCTL